MRDINLEPHEYDNGDRSPEALLRSAQSRELSKSKARISLIVDGIKRDNARKAAKPRRPRGKPFMLAATLCGCWAAGSLTFTQQGLVGDNVPLAAAIAFGPAALLALWMMFTEGD